MKWTGLNELREKFLSFFESKGHLKLESFSLIPKDDKSLLLINSGMAPLKKYFTGEVIPPRKRVTTCQKCIRTPDIERVGITARHGTYFEMLGNFSFGDYFKKEACSWAWEFCVKVLELPIDKLWVSIYHEDNEAFDIWVNEVGVSKDHIVKLGKEDNFWEHGSGPCGPCSELYFDRGESFGCGSKNCGVGCDCDRYVEFWNLVFTQFENDGKNNYSKLKNPNIDTGMGLERLACIMQEVDNLFLVDTVQNIMKHVCKISGVNYGDSEKKDISLRVITDHIRSTTFMIADGVIPSNEGRGYVLRRLIRRASRHGKLLGVNDPFLFDICNTVIDENKSAYPELWEKREFIKKLILIEEENFSKTIDQGLQLLNSMIEKSDSKILSGEGAFKLNDTYGFPIDLTKEILAERGMRVDEEKFKLLLNQQKDKARSARKSQDMEAWKTEEIDFSYIPETNFIGYDSLQSESKVLLIIKDGNIIDRAEEGDKVLIILDKTPFYAQSGGQIGDKGRLLTNNAVIDVIRTTKNTSSVYLHYSLIKKGEISCDDYVNASVDSLTRKKIMRNHTAAHLLQASLRTILGNHVEQAGQFVDDNIVRFDFTHFSALTNDEINKIEDLMNKKILEGIKVEKKEMPIEEARKLGAMALFGEKYGDIVRVVSINNFSIEFCGGTHVDNTAELGLFKIISESSVASGVRRIEAITGTNIIKMMNDLIYQANECARIFKLNSSSDLLKRCSMLVEELKDKEKNIEHLHSKIADMNVSNILSKSVKVKDLNVVWHNFYPEYKDMSSEQLKFICEKVNSKFENYVLALSCVSGGKGTIVVSCGKSAIQKGIKSGNVVKKIAAIAGGNGGGRPDIAMAGAKDILKLDEAISQVENIVSGILNV